MKGTETGELLAVGKILPCPTFCSKSNLLNS
jgi:hypothetical protein